MTPKKRLTRKDPGYYVPLPYAMAIKRIVSEDEIEAFLFNGMKLDLHISGVINISIAVVAHYKEEDHIIGYIPNGMISRIEGLLNHEEQVVVSLEQKKCRRLKNAFWICIDELPELPDFNQ